MAVSVVDSKRNFWLKILSGTIVSVCITLIMILIFALIIRYVGIRDNIIFPINQIIKVFSIFVGAMLSLKRHKEKGLLKGLLIGFAYYILSFVTFSILQGYFSISLSNVYDMFLTTLMGGIIGLIVVHLGK
ncbi:MAG: TIGR04086 family membrane protein [Clostridiales bacterium]|nr:TIGR04086 family membrane protein [Clostridiales bacterium]